MTSSIGVNFHEGDPAIEKPLRNYRIAQIASGCGLLAVVGAACILIFVASFPVLPVVSIAVTLGVALVALLIWSTFRWHELSKKRTGENVPPDEGDLDDSEDQRTDDLEKEQGEVSRDIPVEEIRNESPESPPSADPGAILSTEIAQGPETTKKGDELETTQNHELRNIVNGSEGSGTLVGIAANEKIVIPSLEEVYKSAAHLRLFVESTSGEEPQILSTATRHDINSKGMDEILKNAKSVNFHGREDNKFIFVCQPSGALVKEGICFFAEDIDVAWKKLGNIKNLLLLVKLPETFKVFGATLGNLENILFRSNDIETFEAAQHLEGKFAKLCVIAFCRCNSLTSIKLNGTWDSENLGSLMCTKCPTLKDIYVGDSSVDVDRQKIIQGIHACPLDSGPKIANSFAVHLCDCSIQTSECTRLDLKIKDYGIIFEKSTIDYFPNKSSKTAHVSHGSTIVDKPLFSRNGSSDFKFDGSDNSVTLQKRRSEFFVSLSLDLPQGAHVGFPDKKIIRHVKLDKMTNGCYIDFTPNSNRTLLEFGDSDGSNFPKSIFFSPKNPRTEKELPKIKVNGEIKNVVWLEKPNVLIPIARELENELTKSTGGVAIGTQKWTKEIVEFNYRYFCIN